MPKPSELVAWTTTLVNRIKPSAGAIASGFLYGQRPSPKWFNWILGMHSDWLTWFDESVERLRPSHHSFTAEGTTAWSIPSGLVFIEGVLIAGGRAGDGGGAGAGGNGGPSGEIRHFHLPAVLLSGVSVEVGGPGEFSRIISNGSTLVWAGSIYESAGTWPADVESALALTAHQNIRIPGGDGGAAAPGTQGYHSGYGPGGTGGAPGFRGTPGLGYGAGGCGGRQTSGAASGGGGGAGGYGTAPIAGPGGGTSTSGSAGAQGACFFTAWRDVNA